MTLQARHIRVEVGEIPKKRKEGTIYFSSYEEMSKVLSPQRVAVLEAIRNENPESIYQLAQMLGRDQGNVTKDVQMLEQYGFIKVAKTKEGNRTRSEPKAEAEEIEMIIKLGAGLYGVAKDALEEVSSEFKGEKLEANKKEVKSKYRQTISPVRKTVRNIIRKLDAGE